MKGKLSLSNVYTEIDPSPLTFAYSIKWLTFLSPIIGHSVFDSSNDRFIDNIYVHLDLQ